MGDMGGEDGVLRGEKAEWVGQNNEEHNKDLHKINKNLNCTSFSMTLKGGCKGMGIGPDLKEFSEEPSPNPHLGVPCSTRVEWQWKERKDRWWQAVKTKWPNGFLLQEVWILLVNLSSLSGQTEVQDQWGIQGGKGQVVMMKNQKGGRRRMDLVQWIRYTGDGLLLHAGVTGWWSKMEKSIVET